MGKSKNIMIIRRKNMLYLIGTFFTIVAFMGTSCTDFNLFSWGTPDALELLDKDIDEFLYSLFNLDDFSQQLESSNKRQKALDKLDKKINGASGDAKTKYFMAKAAILARVSLLSKILDLGSTQIYLDIIQNKVSIDEEVSRRNLLDKLFEKANVNHTLSIVTYAVESAQTLNLLGEHLGNTRNSFPWGYGAGPNVMSSQAITGTFISQAFTSGIIDIFVKAVDIGATSDNTLRTRIAIVTEYINNLGTTDVTFYTSTQSGATIRQLLLGTKDAPTGINTLLRAASPTLLLMN